MLAMLNGMLREKLLLPMFGDVAALVSSGVLLSVGILLVAWLAVPWFGALPAREWRLIGLFWLGLTLAFEFGFGRLVQHKAWADLFSAYTFQGGNLWPLVLAVTLLAPWVAARLRGRVQASGAAGMERRT
ncbi:hypothetical protein C8D93_11356 [Sinimarinibacterium flocculans]|uniref:Uncharacterized protein n=2 Tax=Sinimarinibacterium flocculans TaxID=985250 RepID=A0A318E624_9GAMM|nr:hypothetical protein C8D93_11356 [Sinimarinibacterium flocculans]